MAVSDTSGSKNTLRFLYESGSVIGFILNETTPYLYEKNLSGDICGIIDKNGATVASYEYDAWGNELSSNGDTSIIALNPFTYRGYQFDRETGLYYLQSRYFNPQWCQFINADTNLDTQTSIIGTNIFAYCDNNPVMSIDPTGCSTEKELQKDAYVFILITLVGAILSGMFSTITGMDNFSFSFDKSKKYEIYSVVTNAWSTKNMSYNQYTIVTYGATVENWGRWIDRANQQISVFNNVTGYGSSSVEFLKLVAIISSATNLFTFSAAIAFNSIQKYIEALQDTLNTIERNMRGMSLDQFYIFNWTIRYTSSSPFLSKNTDVFYVYSKLANMIY